jgi:hypothetical protein
MKKRRNDHELAEELAASMTSEEDNARYPGREARNLLQRARDAGECPLRVEYLRAAQREIAKLDPARQGQLISKLQSEVLALQGRWGDTELAHVTPGEFVIPRSMQTPELWAKLHAAALQAGIDPARMVVGTSRNSVNPLTGQLEFYDYNGQNIEEIVVPSNINGPNVTAPTYRSLGFDPKGPSWKEVAENHPIAAVPAALAGGWARFVDNHPDGYTGNLHNDSADAYRHVRGSQLLTRVVGPELSKEFTDAYERSNPNPDGERLMDLYNNQVGRNTPGFGNNQIEDELKKGLLRTFPFKRP